MSMAFGHHHGPSVIVVFIQHPCVIEIILEGLPFRYGLLLP
jgi:hypothetical protein